MKTGLILGGVIMLSLAVLFHPLAWTGLFGLILIVFGVFARGNPKTG